MLLLLRVELKVLMEAGGIQAAGCPCTSFLSLTIQFSVVLCMLITSLLIKLFL